MDDLPATKPEPLASGIFSVGLWLLGLAIPLSLVGAEALTLGLLLLFLLRLVKRHRFQLSSRDLPFIAFLLIRLISALFNFHSEYTEKGLTYLFFCVAYIITAWNPESSNPKVWRNFVRGLVIGATIASLAGLYQVAGGAHRGIGLVGGWTVFGSLTGAALVLGIYQAIRGGLFPKKYQDVALLTLVAAGLAASICRAEWVAAFLVLLPAAILFYPRTSAVLGAGIVIVFLAVTPLRERLLTLADPLSNLSGREIIWAPAGELISEKPILGHGLNSFHAVFPVELRPLMTDPGAGDWHNVYLQVAIESGLLGLAAFLWMMGTGLFLAFRRLRLAKTPIEQGAAWGLFLALAFFCIAGGLGAFLVRIPVVVLVFLILGVVRHDNNTGNTFR